MGRFLPHRGTPICFTKKGAFDKVPSTLFGNVGLIGATREDVLNYQVPLAINVYRPTVIILTVGGNDLARILGGGYLERRFLMPLKII